MQTRELYRQKYEAQLKELGAKMEVMKAHAATLSAEAQLDMKPHVDAVQAQLSAAGAKLQEVADATDDKWEELKTQTETSWHDLKAAVEGAYDALKSR